MKIELKEITVRDLTNGYQDNEENGVSDLAESWIYVRPTRESLYTKINNVML